MIRPSPRATLATLLLAIAPITALAADDATPAAAPKVATTPERTPLPADAHVAQTINVHGHTIHYTATVGKLPVRDKDGKTIGEVVYTSYIADGKHRPVTFAVNGGPGASSVYLNMGAIGPKVVAFGAEGDSPSDPATLHDNPGTWLDFTDLVFIDPIGTGYSRSQVDEDTAKKEFFTPTADVSYLSRSIYDWLVKNQRLGSRKYLVGESYGGFRGPRITHYLQTQMGIALNGLVLVSPYLDPSLDNDSDVSPVPWMLTLPSITAAHLEREGKLTDAAMKQVIDYTLGDYAVALLKGRTDPQAREQMIEQVTRMTGLSAEFVRRSAGRLETQAYLREIYRDQGKLGSRYDSNVTEFDPFPTAPEQRTNDPLLDSIMAPTTTAMVDFVTRVVGWKTDARYHALNYDVNKAWAWNDELRKGSAEQLRQALAIDPKMHVLIAHGWNDLSCPFMGSVLIANQIPQMGNDPKRLQVKEYPGGHMFYNRPTSQSAFRGDVEAMFQAH